MKNKKDVLTLIKEYPKNIKKHTKKQLEDIKNIVKRIGWRQPVLVDADTYEIIVGHGRLMTYMKFKDELPLIWVTNDRGETILGAQDTRKLTDEEAIFYRISDNKSNESEWELEFLQDDLILLDTFDTELAKDTGFDIDVIKGVSSTPTINDEQDAFGKTELNTESYTKSVQLIFENNEGYQEFVSMAKQCMELTGKETLPATFLDIMEVYISNND